MRRVSFFQVPAEQGQFSTERARQHTVRRAPYLRLVPTCRPFCLLTTLEIADQASRGISARSKPWSSCLSPGPSGLASSYK